MPALGRTKHEAFCQAYAKGEHQGNACAAYRAVYSRDDGAAASRLQRKREVLQRITEIRAEITAQEAGALQLATEKLGITKEWVLQQLVDNLTAGKKREDGATVNKAAELLGKHLGMFIPAAEQTVNLNLGVEVVDRPPRETLEQWKERRQLELKAVPVKAINGNGKAH